MDLPTWWLFPFGKGGNCLGISSFAFGDFFLDSGFGHVLYAISSISELETVTT